MKIGEILRRWRIMSERHTRDVAKEIGLSHATYSRIENGGKMEGVTLVKLFKWLFEGEEPEGK
jgi:transcriptional regulator with XRE-family HTH domain